jgi:hypothetical protein
MNIPNTYHVQTALGWVLDYEKGQYVTNIRNAFIYSREGSIHLANTIRATGHHAQAYGWNDIRRIARKVGK